MYSDLYSNVVGVFIYPILQQHDQSHFLDVITSTAMTSISILIMSLLRQHHPQLAAVIATLIIGLAIILDEEIESTVVETRNISWNSTLGHLTKHHQLKRKRRLLESHKKSDA